MTIELSTTDSTGKCKSITNETCGAFSEAFDKVEADKNIKTIVVVMTNVTWQQRTERRRNKRGQLTTVSVTRIY